MATIVITGDKCGLKFEVHCTNKTITVQGVIFTLRMSTCFYCISYVAS